MFIFPNFYMCMRIKCVLYYGAYLGHPGGAPPGGEHLPPIREGPGRHEGGPLGYGAQLGGAGRRRESTEDSGGPLLQEAPGRHEGMSVFPPPLFLCFFKILFCVFYLM